MRLATLQWNVGGCRLRREEADPTEYASYATERENLEAVAETLKTLSADLVTLQETHADDSRLQAEGLAQLAGYPFWVNDIYDHSHLEPGQELGQAILSKYPLRDHRFERYVNPELEMVWPDGSHVRTHDKGATTVTVETPGGDLELKTSHMFPFRKFGGDALADSVKMQEVRESIMRALRSEARRLLIQGDFNFDGESLQPFLRPLFERTRKVRPDLTCTDTLELKEVFQREPTTPKGRRYDHVLYRGLELTSSRVLTDVLTDHYPIITTFQLKG